MDNYRPGAVKGEELPPKDPYQRALHIGLCYTYFAYGFWMSLNLLRKHEVSFKCIKGVIGSNLLKKQLMMSAHIIYPLLLVTGFLMSGTGAGRSITTYPKVGDNWTITKQDLDKDESFLENLVSNRKLIHFNHRTLGMILAAITTVQWGFLMISPLSVGGKVAFTTLLGLVLGQLHIGSTMVTRKMQPEHCIWHNMNACLIMMTFLVLFHIGRKPDPKMVTMLINEAKANPTKYEALLKKYSSILKKLGG